MSITSVKFHEFEFFIGQRVAAQVGTKGLWFYGFIEKLSTGMAKVRFDLGAPSHKVKDVKLGDVVPVINWKLVTKGDSFGNLNITKLPPHKAITKDQMPLTSHFLYGLWHYANAIGFKNKLREPKFVMFAQGRALGTCDSEGMAGRQTTISISTRNKSVKNYFEVLVHEMVHQQNFEIDSKNTQDWQDLLRDFHGPTFLRYAGPLKASLGVNISKYANMDDISHSVELDAGDVDKAHARDLFYFVLHFPLQNNNKPVYVGATFKNKEVAEDFYLLIQRTKYRQDIFKYLIGKLLKDGKGSKSFYELTYGEPPDMENVTAYDSTLYIYRSNTAVLRKVMQNIIKVTNVNDVLRKTYAVSPKNLTLVESNKVAELTYNSIQKPWGITS